MSSVPLLNSLEKISWTEFLADLWCEARNVRIGVMSYENSRWEFKYEDHWLSEFGPIRDLHDGIFDKENPCSFINSRIPKQFSKHMMEKISSEGLSVNDKPALLLTFGSKLKFDPYRIIPIRVNWSNEN